MSNQKSWVNPNNSLQRVVLNAAKRALTDLINGRCDESELKALGEKYVAQEIEELRKSGHPLG